MPSSAPSPAAAERPLELEVTGGPAAGQQFSVHDDFTVGSGESGPGTLGGDRWLSSSHALFHRGPDGWAVQDLRSLDGTKVNGRAVRGAASLTGGDVVELGSTRIVVLPDGAGSAAELAASNPAAVARSIRAESRRSLDSRRLIAYLIDSLVVGLAGLAGYEWGRGRAVFLIGAIALGLTYYFLCESLTGQTLGKRITGLRVVRIDGRPLTPSAVAGRTVLRLIDQLAGGLVGMLTMILSGGRRQRLGDLAARTAVARASIPAPRPARTTVLERVALYVYPCLWIAPAVVLFVLVPDTRLLPCREVGISSASGTEGSCLIRGENGELAVFDVANSGHTLRMRGYSVRLVRTASRPAPRALRSARYYSGDSTTVVGLRLAVKNTGGEPLRFDRRWRNVVLGAPRLDGRMVSLRELPRAARPGFRTFAEYKPIAPGQTRVAWVSFSVPPGLVSQLRQPVAGLAFLQPVPGRGYPHMGELRLWRASTPAGVRALRGLNG